MRRDLDRDRVCEQEWLVVYGDGGGEKVNAWSVFFCVCVLRVLR